MAVQHAFRVGAIQAKLAVSRPGDPEEQEADRIANQISNGAAAGTVQRKPATSSLSGEPCAKCPEEHRLHPSPEQGHIPSLSSTSSFPANTRGGQSLPSTVRAFYENKFGHDFSQVRIHTNSDAASAAQSIQARAFTAGQDVTFAAGQFSPETQEGRRLIAHELTHVVQQGAGSRPKGMIQRQPR